jgi:peptidoglycan/LPS O-acetylase OafA/YrhL
MNYRREIDGLRALAVLPVILFHAGFETFSGGFVGVDVFFVISGYLITMIILAELEQGKFSLVNFYERRARRILPALFLVMLVSIPFAWFWLMPSDMRDFSQSLVAVSAFASNILFWRESGYFDPAAELKPLLHTWSLAVEEQYYVLFPLFLNLFWRLGKRSILVILGILFVVSLAVAQWSVYAEPAAAFYLLPTRGWELLIGAFAAFYLSQSNRKDFGREIGEIGGWLGISLIVYGMFAFGKSTPFPSLYTLIPTIGTVLVILFATQQTAAGKFVGHKTFVGIGLVSYSAYLWHQPLFAFARHRSLSEPGKLFLVSLVGLTFLLAYMTWRFVENIFRAKDVIKRKPLFVGFAAGLALFLSIGFVGHKFNGFENYYFSHRADTEYKKVLSYLKYPETNNFRLGYRAGSCYNNRESFSEQDCLLLAEGKKNILMLGDSHSAHFAYAFRSIFPEYNFLQANASGCKPTIPLEGAKSCTELMEFVYFDFLPRTRLDGVILSADWSGDDIEPLINTIGVLNGLDVPVYVLGPGVWFNQTVPELIMRLNIRTFSTPVYARPYLKEQRYSLSERFKRSMGGLNVIYVPIAEVLCPDFYCTLFLRDGIPLMFDNHHLTLEGAQYLLNRLITSRALSLP